ncbi:hypothetical protein BCR42DRAFT_422719 [Absidia repens]|uniref:Uncharacterized protein n=1 Tax=Absidia repens TaxID=90262 RepID=A0A1X2I5U7_9FUNG|nr:hypothetical protein BCR42DRAFT_422719 [Absidia repens]
MTASFQISAQQADEIYQLALQRPPNKSVFQLFKKVQKAIQSRNKKMQIYSWTVEALQRQYERRLCEDRLLVERHKTQVTKLTQDKLQLEKDIHDYTKQIQAQNPHLQTARDDAHTCQTKLQHRQRQYHRYTKIPLVGYSYKRKYLRAQKKTQEADSRVAAQRLVIDRLKEKRMAAAQRIRQELKEQAQLVVDMDGIRSRMADAQALGMTWKEGLIFWTDCMAPLCLAMDQKVVALQHLLRKRKDGNGDDGDSDGDGDGGIYQQEVMSVLKSFRSMCLNFEKMETYGDDRKWRLDDLDFDCAKCMQSVYHDTPLPDKTRPADILCSSCYQDSRTTMIIKKKLGFRQSPSPSPSPSSSTSSSFSSLYSSFSPLVTPSSSRQSSIAIDTSCPTSHSIQYPAYSPPHHIDHPLKT